jgi:hypothetical protein
MLEAEYRLHQILMHLRSKLGVENISAYVLGSSVWGQGLKQRREP